MKKYQFQSLLHSVLGLCLLATTATAADVPAPAHPVNPFFAFDNGVGHNLNWSPAQQAAVLKKLGYDGIGYTGTENFTERQKAFQAQGLKIFNLYVPCYVDKPEPYDPQLKAALQQLQGTGMCLWLTVQGQSTNDARAVCIVREIADEAAAAGVRVALYPHKGFFVPTAEDALRILQQVDRPNVGVTINLCHELMAGNADRIAGIIKTCAPHLFFVSINGADYSGGWDKLIRPLDEGNFDVAGFLKLLGAAGYAGPIGLQCYNLKGDPEENLKRSINAWHQLADRTNSNGNRNYRAQDANHEDKTTHPQ